MGVWGHRLGCGRTLRLVQQFGRNPHSDGPIVARHATARLNLSDCAAYALAAAMNAPLLFKGDDFAATDVRACL
jgi:uncharacterized protein with PIN domain